MNSAVETPTGRKLKPKRTTRASRSRVKKSTQRQSVSKSTYDEFKEFEGKRYTGMKVGRGHTWYYDKGEWKETKQTPDEWRFTYEVSKRRAGKAPKGSGVPVGTGYHWFIVADQFVQKLDANSYRTSMSGLKFKVAHKRAEKETWSASANAQRKRMIQLLREMIGRLEMEESAEIREK
jgi:hypothetical protein